MSDSSFQYQNIAPFNLKKPPEQKNFVAFNQIAVEKSGDNIKIGISEENTDGTVKFIQFFEIPKDQLLDVARTILWFDIEQKVFEHHTKKDKRLSKK